MNKITQSSPLAQSTQPADAEHLKLALKTIDDTTSFIFTLQSHIAAIALSEKHGGDDVSGYINHLFLCNHMISRIDEFSDDLLYASDTLKADIKVQGGSHE